MSEVSPRGVLTVSFGEVCDRGKVREENQDNVRNASLPLGELFIVADGIGGYQGGATASRMVVDGFHSQLAIKSAAYPPDDALREACTYTNTSIHTAASSGDPAKQRMGSTVVLALIQTGASSGNAGGYSGPMAWIGHVGDSRAYLIRGGRLQKITNDHSAVQALLSRNLITEEEARNHPDASVLTRSLGHRPEVEIEIDHVPLQAGDALLLCSDGLWGYVAEADIATVATDAGLSVQTIADTLLSLALDAGGQDNIGIEYIRLGNAAPALPATAPLGSQVNGKSLPRNGGVASSSTQSRPVQAAPGHMARARKQQLAAVALLLLGGVGSAVSAYHWNLFGFGNVIKGNTTVANKSQPRKIAVVGDVPGNWTHRVIEKVIEWRYIPVAYDFKPGCAHQTKDAITIYVDTAYLDRGALIAEIESQYPDLKTLIEKDKKKAVLQPMTSEVQRECGPEAFDVVVILPRGTVAANPAPVQPKPAAVKPGQQPGHAGPGQPSQVNPGQPQAPANTPNTPGASNAGQKGSDAETVPDPSQPPKKPQPDAKPKPHL